MDLIDFKTKSIETAIQIIDKERSFFNDLCIFYYNLLKYLISYNHSRTFRIKRLIIDKYTFYKELPLKIDDQKICINLSEIPYEYIMVFTQIGKCMYMELLGTIVCVDKKIKIIPSTNKINVLFLFESKEITLKICESIKKNMFYHIKYNTLEHKAFEYMLQLE